MSCTHVMVPGCLHCRSGRLQNLPAKPDKKDHLQNYVKLKQIIAISCDGKRLQNLDIDVSAVKPMITHITKFLSTVTPCDVADYH